MRVAAVRGDLSWEGLIRAFNDLNRLSFWQGVEYIEALDETPRDVATLLLVRAKRLPK